MKDKSVYNCCTCYCIIKLWYCELYYILPYNNIVNRHAYNMQDKTQLQLR